jgi:predicted acetyltransferase
VNAGTLYETAKNHIVKWVESMKIELKELSESDDQDIFEMIQEIGLGENGFTTNFAESNFDDFKGSLSRLVEISRGIDIPEGYVPQTIYWLYVNHRPIAYGKLRHKLNEKLLMYGGHVGYIVRPSERGKGYGKLFLAELMKAAKQMEINRLLITCDDNNTRSRKVVESNNGKLEEIIDGICRYWIKT